MADIKNAVAQNVRGKYYVDSSCIYCGVCTDAAPEHFFEHKPMGRAYVRRQPTSVAEDVRCREAMQACPTGSIGDDGENPAAASGGDCFQR